MPSSLACSRQPLEKEHHRDPTPDRQARPLRPPVPLVPPVVPPSQPRSTSSPSLASGALAIWPAAPLPFRNNAPWSTLSFTACANPPAAIRVQQKPDLSQPSTGATGCARLHHRCFKACSTTVFQFVILLHQPAFPKRYAWDPSSSSSLALLYRTATCCTPRGTNARASCSLRHFTSSAAALRSRVRSQLYGYVPFRVRHVRRHILRPRPFPRNHSSTIHHNNSTHSANITTSQITSIDNARSTVTNIASQARTPLKHRTIRREFSPTNLTQ